MIWNENSRGWTIDEFPRIFQKFSILDKCFITILNHTKMGTFFWSKQKKWLLNQGKFFVLRNWSYLHSNHFSRWNGFQTLRQFSKKHCFTTILKKKHTQFHLCMAWCPRHPNKEEYQWTVRIDFLWMMATPSP